MAKPTILLLLISSILVVTGQAAAAATKLSPDAEKAIGEFTPELQKVVDDVMSAAPPAKHKETQEAVGKHVQVVISALAKARASGDDKKILRIYFTVKMARVMISAPLPDKKLKLMEDEFNSVAAPSPLDCPTVDKAFCEMHSKIGKAVDGVVAASPDKKKADEVRGTIVEKIVWPTSSTVNEAYAHGDEKKIVQVLAAYTKAADEVIAAAPAEKLKVMEKTFAAAAAAAN